jgi:hypothetical protein
MERKDLKGESSTLCSVRFKGADGAELALDIPTVRCKREACAVPPG